MPQSCISIVRLGPAETPPTILIQNALLSFLGDGDPDAAEPTNNTMHIANRYFTAKVRLEYLQSSDTGDLWKEDGIILVFANDPLEFESDNQTAGSNHSNYHSFDALTVNYHNLVTADADIAGELLRLCVGLSSQPLSDSYKASKQYEQEYARRIHWCLDHNYEYVDCDLLNLDKGHEDRDKEGFARIVEAIRGTVWSSAVMQAKKTVELKQTYQQDKALVGVDSAEDAHVNEYEPPDPLQLPPVGDVMISPTKEEDCAREEMARQELMAECIQDNDFTATESFERNNGQRLGKDEESIFNTMESTLKQAALIREASRAGTMTDDERRQRAGDAATLLYHMMEQMSFDESDDESEHSEEDTVMDCKQQEVE
jgi:hypothetical protein